MIDYEPNHHRNMAGWKQIGCDKRDKMVLKAAATLNHGLRVESTITDPQGLHGESLVFTEWWRGASPELRDYISGDPRRCSHYEAVGPEARYEIEEEA